MPTPERRQIPRTALERLAYIHIEPDNGGIVLNVSPDGLCFHSIAAVVKNGPLRFSLLEQTRRIMSSALNLAKVKLQEHGLEPPPNWDVDHLLVPPNYSSAFVEVVDRVVSDGHRARLLPLAMELRLFGFGGDERGSSGLIKRVSYAQPLTSLVRGFAVQSLGLPSALVDGPAFLLNTVKRVIGEGNMASSGSPDVPLLPGMKVAKT